MRFIAQEDGISNENVKEFIDALIMMNEKEVEKLEKDMEAK